MKIIKIAAVTMVAIFVAAGLALVFGIPVGFLVSSIAGRVNSETGYRMVISGGAKLVLRPSLSLRIGSFTLTDDRDQTLQRRLTADGARIDVSAHSLLSGQPHVTEIALVQPTFFVPLVRHRSATSRPSERQGGSPVSFSGVTIDRVVVEDGTVVFSNPREAIDDRLEHVEVSARLSKPDDAIEVRATARAGEHTLGLSMKGKIPGLRIDGQSIPLEFTVEAPGLLQDLMPGVAELKVNRSSIVLNNLSGTIGQNKFSGWTTIDLADKPKVRMDLDFQRLSIAEAQSSSNANIAPPGNLDQPWSDQPFSVAALNFFDAEVQISATELKVDKFRFAPISITAVLSDGLLRGAVTRTSGYGGQIQGTAVVDASGTEPSCAVRVDFTGVQALPFLSDVAGFTHLDGRMVAKIDARGRGNSTRAIMSSLSGAVDVLFENGEIRGLNVADMIRTVAASIIEGWNESGAKATDLSQLSAFFRIERGRATTDNLRLVGPLVRVSGAGTADLGAKTLQFKLEPKLVASLQGQGSATNPVGLGVPVVVQGNWGAPRIYPEISGILDNPEAAFGKLKELGSGLFGTSPGQTNAPGDSLLKGLEGLIGPRDKPPQQSPPSQPNSTQSRTDETPSSRSQDAPSRPQPAPSRSQAAPSRSQDAPSRSQDAPSRSQDAPSRSQDSQTQIRDLMRDLLGR